MRRYILTLSAILFPAALIACGDSGGGNGGSGGGTGGGGTGGSTSSSSSSSTTSSSSSSTTSSSSSSTTSSSSSSGSTTCGVTGTKDTCENACAAVYQCGLLTCGGAAQLCPSFGSATPEAAFIPGCVTGCQGNPLFLQIVDPAACDTTITTLSTASAQFKGACGN